MESQAPVATFSLITSSISIKPIKIICNKLVTQVDDSPKKSPKYRKVGKNTKALLIEMVDSGSSIVSASSKLGINYSTAKSIIQTRNKEQATPKGQTHLFTDVSNQKQPSQSQSVGC